MKSSKFLTFSVLIILIILVSIVLARNSREHFADGTTSSTTTNDGTSSSTTTNDGTTSSTTTENGSTQAGSTQAGSTQAGSTQAGSTQAGSTQAGSTQAGSTQAGSTQAGSTQAGSTQAGSTQAGSTQAGSTQAGSTQAGSTQAGSTQAGSTQAGSTQAGSTSTASPTTTAAPPPPAPTTSTTTAPPPPAPTTTTTRETKDESPRIMCSGLPVDGESTYARPLCGSVEEGTSPACRINEAYKYCIDVDKDSPPCNMFNGEEINRCPDSCELHVVGGNKAICREPNLGRLSCSEYNYLDKEDCPVGVNDACQLDGDICRSKPGLAGCGDRLTYNDCVNDDNCYIKPERGGFKCKTVPEDESDSNWDEYIKSRGNNNVTTPSDDESLDSDLLLTNELLRNTRDSKNRNLAVHSLIRNYYQKMRKITDDISNDLPY